MMLILNLCFNSIGRWSQDTGSDNEIQPNLVQSTLKNSVTQSSMPLPNPDLTLDTNHVRKLNGQYGHESIYGRNISHSEQNINSKYEEGQNSTPQMPQFIDKNYDKVNYGHNDYRYEDQRSPYSNGKDMYDKQEFSDNMQHRNEDNSHEYAINSSNYLNDRCGINVVPHNQYLAYSNSDNMCNQDINMTNTYCSDYPDITDRISVNSEKYNICDKYLFPYTG